MTVTTQRTKKMDISETTFKQSLKSVGHVIDAVPI